MLGPVLALAMITVLLGIFMEPVIRFSVIAAEQLLDPGPYVSAVLGGAG